jgi:hypothetical protein
MITHTSYCPGCQSKLEMVDHLTLCPNDNCAWVMFYGRPYYLGQPSYLNRI